MVGSGTGGARRANRTGLTGSRARGPAPAVTITVTSIALTPVPAKYNPAVTELEAWHKKKHRTDGYKKLTREKIALDDYRSLVNIP